MQNMTIEDLDIKIKGLDIKIEDLDRRIEDLDRRIGQNINQLRQEMSEKVHQITLTMVGVIVSIWAVTLITASALYIVTH